MDGKIKEQYAICDMHARTQIRVGTDDPERPEQMCMKEHTECIPS